MKRKIEYKIIFTYNLNKIVSRYIYLYNYKYVKR